MRSRPNRPIQRLNSEPFPDHGWARWIWPRGLVSDGSLVAVTLAAAGLAPAQEALRSSMAGEEAAATRLHQLEAQAYNLSWGDLRLQAAPSMEVKYNDNVNISSTAPKADFIIRPLLSLAASYPLTRQNALSLSVGLGYNAYVTHHEYSALRLEPGSELSLDVYIKDLWINVHDRFQYISDPGAQAALAGGAARFGGLYNTPGLTTTWDFRDLIFTLGFDYTTFSSSVAYYDYLNRASELPLARVGVQLHPTLTAGLEGTVASTTYELPFLNDSTGYSGGIYADWRPGTALQVKPRFGYSVYDFRQTSQVMRAVDQDAWYVDLTLSHRVTDALQYSLSVGHEIRLGLQADSITAWYLRPSLGWGITKSVKIRPYLEYEQGTQGSGAREDNYQWMGAGFGVEYKLMKHTTLGLNYRHTLRSSAAGGFGYTQNVMGLQLTYQL